MPLCKCSPCKYVICLHSLKSAWAIHPLDFTDCQVWTAHCFLLLHPFLHPKNSSNLGVWLHIWSGRSLIILISNLWESKYTQLQLSRFTRKKIIYLHWYKVDIYIFFSLKVRWENYVGSFCRSTQSFMSYFLFLIIVVFQKDLIILLSPWKIISIHSWWD